MADTPAPARIRDRKDILPFLAFLVLFLLMFREFFFCGKTIFDRDVTLWEIPARQLCTQLLREGGFALWTDAYGGGQPFLANLKTAVLYPAMFLYLWLPFFAAFKIYYLIHVTLTWTGIYFLGKSYGLSRQAAFFGASLFVFSGMYLSSFEFYNHIAALAWMPWILVLLTLPWRRWEPRIAALAGLWALSILAGAPEITLMTLILGGLQILFMARDRGRRLTLTAASLALALLISAAQLLPSLELWKQSERGSSHFVEWSLEGVQLLNLPFADILGNDRAPGHALYWAGHFFDRGYPLYYSLYIGLGTLALALWALSRLRSRKVLFLGISILLFLILASGRYSPFQSLFGTLPLVSSIRYPVKFFLGSVFSVCLLAAAGFDHLFNSGPRRKNTGRRWGGALAVLGMLLAVFSHPLAAELGRGLAVTGTDSLKEIRISLISAAILAGFLGLVFFLSTLTGLRCRLGGLLLIGIAIFDLTYHNRHINPLTPTSFFGTRESEANHQLPVRIFREDDVPKFLRRGNADILRLAHYARRSMYPLTGIADGVFYLFDEDTLDIYPREYRRLSDAFLRYPREERVKLLSLEGCQYYIGHSQIPALTAEEHSSGEGSIFFHRIAAEVPRARLVHECVRAASLEEKLRIGLQDGFDPRRTVIVDQDLPVERGEPRPGDELVDFAGTKQGKIHGFVTVSRAAFVVFPGNMAKGWRARVDGRPADVFRANLSSKGVVVPAGRHEVELKYEPRSFAVGRIISILAILVLGSLVIISTLKRTKRPVSGCLTAPVFL